ncbi:MAG: periplasmic divalent cation tolerance protein [Thermoplasmata archaeon]|jgi:periplasmic divalent cation tolerance protein|nr:periplasmic divalent cation tolerance protein [Thermoplasmata archaeon]
MQRMWLVRTTFADGSLAAELARDLAESGLAACVHVQEVTSTYMWEGEACEETEWLLEARTTGDVVEETRRYLRKAHPYQLPCIEAWMVEGSEEYAAWAVGVQREQKGKTLRPAG